MKVAFGADHGGYALKQELIARLIGRHEIQDMGAHSLVPEDDYVDFALPVARAVSSGAAERGVVICGSGVGACVVANKVTGVRAGICHDTYSAHQGVEHDDMNVLCLGARVVGVEVAAELVDAFLDARFSGEPRHQRRLDKLFEIERGRSAG